MPDVYKIETQITVDDVVSSFGLYYQQTAGPTDATAGLDAARSWWFSCQAALLDLLATDVKVQGVRGIKVFPVGGSMGWHPQNDIAGLRSGTALPALSTFILNLRNSTGVLPRPGRVSISGCSKTDLLSGQWEPGFISTEGSAFASAILSITPAPASTFAGDLVVLRRYEVVVTDPGPPPVKELVKLVPPVAVLVDSIDGSPTPGRQIRRKSKQFGS